MQEREGDRVSDRVQIEMREREKTGEKKKKEKGEKGAGEEQGGEGKGREEEGEEAWRRRWRNKEKENERRRKEGKEEKETGVCVWGAWRGLLICDSGQASSSYPRRKYIISWVAIVGHCFVLY